jgi:hypothetical protein
MVSATRPRTVVAVLCAVVLAAASGCGGGGGGGTTTSTPPTAAAAMPSPGGQTYTSKAFVLPLTITVDPVLKTPPSLDSRNLLSWDAAASDDNKVRFLVPVELYRPGSSKPEALPGDYLTYLRGFTKANAQLSKVDKVNVGGHRATLMDLTWDSDAARPDGYFDGALGCPAAGADQADGCFGPQTDLVLRLAVVDVGETTLLAWARMSRQNPDRSFAAVFERMLTTVRFR